MGNKRKDGDNAHATNGNASMVSKLVTRSVVSGIVSRIDLIDFISSGGGAK